MGKIVVIGGGGHAKVIISILKKLNKFEISGYIDIKDKGKILGINFLGNDNDIDAVCKKNRIENAVIGIGQIEGLSLRIKLAHDLKMKNLKIPPIISPDAVINEDVEFGDGTVVMDGVVINSGTRIGFFSIINTCVTIDHDCQIGDFVHIAPGSVISGGVIINEFTLIGTGTSIIQNKVITSNCIIGAGSVVTENCQETGTYFGIPASIKRNI